MKLFKKNSPFLLLLLLFIVINAVLRTVLLFHPITQSEFNFAEIIKMYALGEEGSSPANADTLASPFSCRG